VQKSAEKVLACLQIFGSRGHSPGCVCAIEGHFEGKTSRVYYEVGLVLA
jgi:hypothetical protein